MTAEIRIGKHTAKINVDLQPITICASSMRLFKQAVIILQAARLFRRDYPCLVKVACSALTKKPTWRRIRFARLKK